MRTLIPTMLLGSTLALTACMNRNDAVGTDTAEAAIDSADSASAEGNVMMAAVDSSDSAAFSALTVDAVALRVAANITGRHLPTGCATVTQTGTTIKAIYNDCTGPRGLRHVSGEMDFSVSVSLAGAITVHGTSVDLKVNDADLEVDATGTYTSSGTGHSLVVATTGTGTGPRGMTVDHEGNYTINWDSATQCHSIMGAWSTEIGARTRSNDVTLTRCAAGCPTGTITHTFLRGQSMTITFDGTAQATWAASDGRSGSVTLGCQ